MLLRAYGLAARMAQPLALPWLRRRAARGLEDSSRFDERLGRPGLPRPAGRLVWLHAASLGETRAMLPLVDAIRARGLGLVVTTATLSANRLAADLLAEKACVQLAPLDLPRGLAAFLDHWRPSLALLVESEIWPNRLTALVARRLPVVVVNGRMSAESARRWSRVPRTARTLFGSLALVLAQGETDARRFGELGAPDVVPIGNLKRAAAPLPADAAELAALRAAVHGRRIWLAASTHPGEEEAAADAHRFAAAAHPGLLTLVVPRHPHRAAEARDAFASRGLAIGRRSADRLPRPAMAAFLGDTLGELGLWYRLAELAFVGGSLPPLGGHNPIEPARLGCPLLLGPHLAHVEELAAPLLAAGGALGVADTAALAAAVTALLGDAETLTTMAERANEVAREGGDVLDAVMQRLSPWLDRA
jgi:3-deoxy-D-manno-octulosonic-acid transferase